MPHDPAAYGDCFAPFYDHMYPSAEPGAVDFLASLAGDGGRVLELGIGTGRMAIPLVERGLRVRGVDASRSMVERLHAKPRGAEIPVDVRDFADLSGVEGGPFDLVFCTFSTIYALLTQDDQVRCLGGAAALLAPGGHLVLEGFVPDPERVASLRPFLAGGFSSDAVFLDVAALDSTQQRISTRLVRLAEDGVRILPIEIRYAWPSELDLMARLAGLEAVGRWSGWNREPFTRRSGVHVSAWRRPGP